MCETGEEMGLESVRCVRLWGGGGEGEERGVVQKRAGLEVEREQRWQLGQELSLLL